MRARSAAAPEPALLVALEFQPRRLLLQRDQQRPVLANRDAERAGSRRQPGEPHPYLQRLRRRPAHGRHDGSRLDHSGGKCGGNQAAVQGDPIQGDQHRGVGELWGAEQPLRQRDGRDHPEAQHRAHATQQQRGAQRGAEDQSKRIQTVLRDQARDAHRRNRQTDCEIDREGMAGAQLGQPPRAPSHPTRPLGRAPTAAQAAGLGVARPARRAWRR